MAVIGKVLRIIRTMNWDNFWVWVNNISSLVWLIIPIIGLVRIMKIEQKTKPIPELKIGDEKLKKRFEFQIGWKKFKITINW